MMHEISKIAPGLFQKRAFCLLFAIIFWTVQVYAQELFQLAPPYLKCSSVFFKKEALVSLDFAQAETVIHYTTNGQEPTEKDPVYRIPLHIKRNNTTIKARVFGTGFLPSNSVSVTVFKQGFEIKSVSTTLPNPRYPGTGNSTLVDGQGGGKDHGNKTWMGFQKDTIMVLLKLDRPQKLHQISLHVLQSQGAWIFLPQKIEVFAPKKDALEWVLLDSKNFSSSEKAKSDRCEALKIDLHPAFKTAQILLKIYPLASIPDWHVGKGNPAWLFIEELNLY